MDPLFQEFEFVYPNGDLFYDRSGALSRRLKEIFPGLASKESNLDQREFSNSDPNVDLLFGVAVSRLQTFGREIKDFDQKASAFLSSVSEFFEIDVLNRFSFKHVLGRAFSTVAEAQEYLWLIVGEEQKAKFASVAPLGTWTSIQGEFSQGAMTFESRISLMKLIPAQELDIGKHLMDKMRSIIFPSVEFTGATLEEAVEYLNIKGRDHDVSEANPQKRGVQITIEDVFDIDNSLSLNLRNVSMLETLRQIIELTQLKVKLGPDRVFVVNKSDIGNLPHITFHLKVIGTQPISLADFDAAAFIQNFRETHSKEILSKLAPDLVK